MLKSLSSLRLTSVTSMHSLTHPHPPSHPTPPSPPQSRTASIIGCLVFFMGFFIFIGVSGSQPSRNQILACCLHPANAFTFGTQAFAEYEGARVGVTSKTWNVSNQYNVTFQDTLNMMLADTIWMGFLAWYLAQVLPSEFGTNRPWYFLLTPAYWLSCCGLGKARVAKLNGGESMQGDEAAGYVEPVTDNLARQVSGCGVGG